MAKVSATVCNVERSRTSCQNVETEFMTPAATVLHKKSFLRSAASSGPERRARMSRLSS